MGCSFSRCLGRRAQAFAIPVAAVLLLGIPKALLATDKESGLEAGRAQKPLQYEVNVTLKLIQVFVTGPDGEPARDLEKADFVLYDNGKAQKITDLEKHFILLREAVAAGQNVSEAAADPSPLLKRKYILLFDDESNDLAGVAKSRKAALEFLDKSVQQGDEVAFFSCSPTRGLTIHEYFTSDHQTIRKAIEKTRSIPGATLGGLAVESFIGHQIASPEHPTVEDVSSLFQGVSARQQAAGASLPYGRRGFMARLAEVAKALRQVDGQKNIILFSKEFGHILDGPSGHDAALFREMAKELASANCPVFVINTAGGLERAAAPNAGLGYLSETTGGRYYDAVDRYAENARSIANITSNYYVLGYPVGSSWDGTFHEVRVEVRRNKYKTFGQRGYFDPLPFNKLSAMERSLHLIRIALGEDPSLGPPIDFPLAVLPYSERPGANTLLLSWIPVRTMRESIGNKTEIVSLVLAEDKSVVAGRRAEVDWTNLDAETLCQYSAASLVPGRYEARVIVRDLETGRFAVGACSVEVPAASAASLRLFPPLFVTSFRSAQYANFSGDAKDQDGQSFSLTQAYLFPTQKYTPAPAELEEGRETFRAVLRCEQNGPVVRDFRVRAEIEIPGVGRSTPLAVALLDRFERKDLLFLILEFRAPAPLMAGFYTLRVLAEDPRTGTRAWSTTELIVKQ